MQQRLNIIQKVYLLHEHASIERQGKVYMISNKQALLYRILMTIQKMVKAIVPYFGHPTGPGAKTSIAFKLQAWSLPSQLILVIHGEGILQ